MVPAVAALAAPRASMKEITNTPFAVPNIVSLLVVVAAPVVAGNQALPTVTTGGV
jgi:hypothetical protein